MADASWAVETLRDITIKEVKFLYGVKDRVVDLESNLQSMLAFLKDADKWPPERFDSAIVRSRVSELMDLATCSKELLEEYDVEVTSKRGERNLFERVACILCECWDVHKIGKQIEGIMSSVAKLTKDLESIHNTPSFERNDDQRLQRLTYGHENVEHFVGMKNDIDRLVLRMKNDDRSSRVISICGMGGLGKTTLARKIYHHKDVLSCFEARAWVCISQKLQAKAIFQEILRQLLPGENNKRITRMEEAELGRELYHIQKVKKCLVVLDDIWEIDHWNILKDAFPIAESKSKILLTTRNQRVAETEFVHKLDFLTEDESWDLLQKIALPIHQSEVQQQYFVANSKQFEAKGRELVRKCGCLPKAVSAIGGILLKEAEERPHNLGDWNKVLENMDLHMKESVEHVLNLSYNVLPHHLKLCFLYLGCFPEDKDIEVDDVYLIWMAEGLISSSDDKGKNETLRDVAERYLNELASKCMVQLKMNGIFKLCRLHALVRYLCLLKGKEEKFFEDSRGKFRSLVNYLGDDDSQFKNANLRYLLLLSKSKYDRHDFTNIWKNLLGNALLRYLKVLVLEFCNFEDKKLPRAVRKLVMLKHLSIRHSIVVELPEFVCKLPWLQSMDLRVEREITLPSSIEKMGPLRHLFLNPRGTTKIDGGRLMRLDELTELETFIGFNSKAFDTKNLLKLKKLRRFDAIVDDIESFIAVVGIINELKDQLREASLQIHVENDLSSVIGSDFIDSIKSCPLHHLSIYGKLMRLPTWDPQLLQNLVSLSLSGSEIEEDPMETLQHLRTLRSLQLGNDAFVGTEMVCKSKGFPQLQSLKLWGLSKLVGWRVEAESMPNLSDLYIDHCPTLEMIPQGIISMVSITNLTISRMPSSFMERLRRGGEDYPQISRIPFLHLKDC